MPEDEEKLKDGKVGPGKSKDLSHVPCKFFKVGGCTAGASCPFSHTFTPGEKADKDVCAWFVKGTCKFGHKCALAHILPGQGMNMDRRNKKAAQMAAGKGKGGDVTPREGGKRERGRKAPITMSLKASISPSAPAPALKDADFSNFGALGSSSETAEKDSSASGKLSFANAAKGAAQPQPPPPTESKLSESKPREEGVPISTPRAHMSPSKPAMDFGPIGSPPRSWTGKSHLQSPPRGQPSRVQLDPGEGDEVNDGEMFLPGSLSDLLTADELARRRGTSAGPSSGSGAVSRSVPAPSLLSTTSHAVSTTASHQHTPSLGSVPHPLPISPSISVPLTGQEGIWSSPPPSAYLNLAPSNASGAFLQNSGALPRRYLPAATAASYDMVAPATGGVGMSLPQGLAAGYSRIHARPAPPTLVGGTPSSFGASSILDSHGASNGFNSGPWGAGVNGNGAVPSSVGSGLGLGISARDKSREWGASSYGTGAGSFGGSPVSSSFFQSHLHHQHQQQQSNGPPPGLGFSAGSYKDRQMPMFSPDRPTFSRDRFADRAAGIAPSPVAENPAPSAQEDDDLFVLDG